MRHDFTLVANIYLGSKSNEADGIAIAFHRGSIWFVGDRGGLGILSAPQGIGFELDTYWIASSDENRFCSKGLALFKELSHAF